ncbi:MAG: cupin domain-containing protein [Hafnia sp.]|uniref:Cupin domain-containing protein n=1 Tax=Pseudomonas fontis TaxID=2942633 RepID=A0ABT5NNQ9_9PSED|nr:cupin domain-containing protein [Pseudomonas fontis]MDD0973037.1 cupin domain-containing protein [Pseudomonas fontis]MDD0989806.1 cupin domain-containing protein [Pseudomonas fontis]
MKVSEIFKTIVHRTLLEDSATVDAPGDRVIDLGLGEACLPDLEFQPYQPGVRKNVLIHPIFDNSKDDPSGSDCAILQYLPGAFTPKHLHVGYETVLVLKGEYVENDVLYHPGTLIVREPGTTHEMRTTTGCVILAFRDMPVKQLT